MFMLPMVGYEYFLESPNSVVFSEHGLLYISPPNVSHCPPKNDTILKELYIL